MTNTKKQQKALSKKKNALPKRKNANEGKDANKMSTQAISPTRGTFKVRLPIKAAVIVLSVIALSWFFEGCRQVKEGITFTHVAMLIGGIVSTAGLLWLQAFWIYLEEKTKGTLRRKNAHFEQVEEYWNSRKEEIATKQRLSAGTFNRSGDKPEEPKTVAMDEGAGAFTKGNRSD